LTAKACNFAQLTISHFTLENPKSHFQQYYYYYYYYYILLIIFVISE